MPNRTRRRMLMRVSSVALLCIASSLVLPATADAGACTGATAVAAHYVLTSSTKGDYANFQIVRGNSIIGAGVNLDNSYNWPIDTDVNASYSYGPTIVYETVYWNYTDSVRTTAGSVYVTYCPQ